MSAEHGQGGSADLVVGADGLARCWWAAGDRDYAAYHDEEWGRPVTGERELFERLSLEGFQAGLSWLVILRKRAAFREAFAGFDAEAVARFTDQDVGRLVEDAGIVRNRAKIDATIHNARTLLDLHERGERLSDLLWSHRPAPRPAPRTRSDVPAQTAASRALSGALRSRGFRFVGPTSCYATMQATGVVDDHLAGCHARGASAAPTD